jgi:hypothetical protein
MRLAARHTHGVLGGADETWWSRLAHPALHTWTTGEPLRLVAQGRPKGDPEPTALCCDGRLRIDRHEVLRRFVEGRPVSHVTTAFLGWLGEALARERKTVLVLIWDNGSWHLSQEVRHWIRAHKQRVTQAGGIRRVVSRLPIKSPWLNPLEPHWVHGQRAIVEPARLLTAAEVISRVCEYFEVEHLEPLKQKVA